MSLMNFTHLFAEEKNEDHPFRLSKYTKPLFDNKTYYSTFFPRTDRKSSQYLFQSKVNPTFSFDNSLPEINNPIEQFSLIPKKELVFSLQTTYDITSTSKNKKKYLKTALEITVSNVLLWAFDHYVRDKSWAKISFKTVIWNFKHGPDWDIDAIFTNHFMHPYHGAIHFSIARANRFDFTESAVWAFLGSFMWEFFLESAGSHNNPPSLNDLMMNALGGAALGETLFRTANLLIDESSVGTERFIRELFAFLINPSFGFRVFSGEAFRRGNPPEKHYFSLNVPIGIYRSSAYKPSFLIAANLEYKDYLKPNLLTIKSYDWFTFDFRLGFYDYGINDIEYEIYTTGILTGKKVKYGLAGLFGIFDYIDTHATDRISALGLGPGFMTAAPPDSDLIFSSSGVLSFIVGASTPSFDIEYYHFGKKFNDPYYFGPGMMGRVKFEFGKKGLGSIHTGYSQYWIHSIYTSANEYLGILSLNINYDLSSRSEISLGYEYYLRHASHQNERFTGTTLSVRAIYIFKF